MRFAAWFSALALIVAPVTAGAQNMAALEATEPGTQRIAINQYELTLTLDDAPDCERSARFTLTEDGNPVFEGVHEELCSWVFGPHLRLQEMDAGNDAPELFVTQYTGGAHCCNEVSVVTKTDEGWKQVELGYFDGDPQGVYPTDVDYDNSFEVATFDNRFLYTFAPYAGSVAPTQILVVEGGELRDATRDERFRWHVEREMRNMGEMPSDPNWSPNAWLAAHAAYQALLGEPDPLAFAIENHDPNDTWGLTRCTVEEVDFSCPDGKEETISFEAGLTEFLTDAGYLDPEAQP